jgi:hypothetical protein
MSNSTKPVHEIRMGRIKAAIWRNLTENGSMHNVTLSRLYHTDDGWATTTSFGREDLPLVRKVADLAHTWIYEQAAKKDDAADGQGNGKRPSNAPSGAT